MVIVENMHQIVANGSSTERKFEGLPLENGVCTSPTVLPKYKRRKVSAVRDFPPGCGRLAPRINMKPMEAMGFVGTDENPVGRDMSGAVLETDSRKRSGTGVESHSPEGLESLVLTEVLKTSNDLESNVEKLVVLSNKVDRPELLNVEPVVVEMPTASDNTELIDQLKGLERETSELSKDSHKVEIAALAEDMVELSCLKLLSLPNRPLTNGNISEKTVTRNYPPRRRISAIRDFPPFCGRNAPRLNEEDCLRTPASSKSKSLDQEKSGVEEKLLEETLRTDVKQIGDDVQDEGNLKKKGREFVSKNFRDKVQVESEGDGTKEARKLVESGTFSEIRADWNDKREKSLRPPQKSDLNHPDCKSQTDSKEDEMEVGNLEGEVGKENVWFDGEVRTLEGRVGKEIVVYNGEVGGLEGKVGKEIMAYDGELGDLKGKMSNDIVVYDREVGGLEEKEFVVHRRDKSRKRKFSDSSGSRNQSQREDVVLELDMDRVIVQGLMAAPNCPWRQGKGAVKPNPTGGTRGSKGKIHDLLEQEKSKSFRAKKADTENLGVKSMKKKLPSTGKAAYHGSYELAVRDEVDSFPHDEEHEDFHVRPRSHDFDVSLPPFGPCRSSGKGDDPDAIVTRNKVRETLRLFQAVCRKLLQEEEAKSKEGGNASKRIDLQAAKILKAKEKYVNTGKQILGPVPGVEVGDEFHYRVELATIGLHRLFQAGIDYVKQGGKILATSIVASGGYADDLDNSNVLIYTGSGGNVIGGDNKQPEDQKLERGNLALKNSIYAKNPVRVIRGFKETKASDSSDTRAKTVTTYTYDGLYLVEKYWQEMGPHGKLVFKFQLVRIPGQPELAWTEVKKSKKSKIREGLCVNDISQGKELIPICAVNTIDDEKPPPFNYITSMIYPNWCSPIPLEGCGCIGGCSDSETCSCAVRNGGGEIPYNHNGAIVEVKPLVYECGPCCKCPPSCHNRVSQHGIKFQLEIFKTESRGWGVRSLNSIPSGSFICEYLGELLEDTEAEQRTGNDEYLFDIGQNYNDLTLWDGLSNLMPDSQSSSLEFVEDGSFTIDAAHYGNVGRFINHSCSPNLYAQNVLYDHEDKRMPHIMFFAAENIPPLQELTYHYNYTIDQVRDSDGNIREKSCYCGSLECTGRMY